MTIDANEPMLRFQNSAVQGAGAIRQDVYLHRLHMRELLQYGPHIDSMPRECNPPLLPSLMPSPPIGPVIDRTTPYTLRPDPVWPVDDPRRRNR